MTGFRFLDEAIVELEDAAAYYEELSTTLSFELRDEITRSLRHLVEFPKAAKPVDKRHRSCKLRRFPYTLVYRIEGKDVVIVAVAHAKRRQRYWRER